MLQENVLHLISSKLVNERIESELELENLLMKNNIENFSEYTKNVIESINKYKETVSTLQF